MPGRKGKGQRGYIAPGRKDVYEALRRQGKSKKLSAQIANAGRTAAGRKAMARKAARTRKRRGH